MPSGVFRNDLIEDGAQLRVGLRFHDAMHTGNTNVPLACAPTRRRWPPTPVANGHAEADASTLTRFEFDSARHDAFTEILFAQPMNLFQ